MIDFKIKDLDVIVDYQVNTRTRGWHIVFEKPNIIHFTSNKEMTIEELQLELNRHYRFFKRRMDIIPKEYKKSIHFLGIEYELITYASDVRKLVLMGDKAYLYTDTEDYEINKGIVNSFYEEALRDFMYKYLDQAKRDLKISYDITIEYKQVKSYYGECIPKKRKMIFQQSLAKYEEYYILSVLYHELAHFYYQNHQEGFYTLLEEVFPGYRQVQASLRRTKYNDVY